MTFNYVQRTYSLSHVTKETLTLFSWMCHLHRLVVTIYTHRQHSEHTKNEIFRSWMAKKAEKRETDTSMMLDVEYFFWKNTRFFSQWMKEALETCIHSNAKLKNNWVVRTWLLWFRRPISNEAYMLNESSNFIRRLISKWFHYIQCVIEKFCYDFSFHQLTFSLFSIFIILLSRLFRAVVFSNFIIKKKCKKMLLCSHDFPMFSTSNKMQLFISYNVVHWNTEPSYFYSSSQTTKSHKFCTHFRFPFETVCVFVCCKTDFPCIVFDTLY